MNEKTRFLLKNLLKGIIWLAAILFIFLYIKNNIDTSIYEKYKYFLNNNITVYTTYILSEIFFGIIPPELFMLWALDKGSLDFYVAIIFILALISYVAGWITYLFGRYLNRTIFFRFIRKKFLGKYEKLLNEYGPYLIIVAAITPVPYSAVCMLVGSATYPFKKFFLYSLFRFARYAVYSFIIWETVQL